MLKSDMLKIVKELQFDKPVVVYKNEVTEIILLRPSILSNRFKYYDKNKNFQVWIKQGGKKFRPNHLRLLIDLNLRARCREDLIIELLSAFDNIFYGKDPEIELQRLSEQKFEHYLNDIITIGVLSQTLILEQEYGYHKESKYNPPSLYLQGWIRAFICNIKEIDILLARICGNNPPEVRFTCQDDKNHKKYSKENKPIWYLEDNS
ncbi:MAG: hypothetical protein ACMXYL_00995 [Candidatus Woesearchaeota archaeon]